MARDVRRHATAWRASGRDPLAAGAGLVFSQAGNGVVTARAASDGHLIWRSRKLRDIEPHYAIAAAGALYVAGNNGMARLDEKSGKPEWIVDDGAAYSYPSLHYGVLFVTVTVGGSMPLNQHRLSAAYDAQTAAERASATDASVVGYDRDAFYVNADAGAGSVIEDGHYVAARVSRISLRSGQIAWTKDFRPDPHNYERAQDQTAFPVLISASGRVTLQLGNATYLYKMQPSPASQTPLRFDALGVAISAVGDEVWTIDAQGLSEIRIDGQTAYRWRVARFALPSPDSLGSHVLPSTQGQPIWLLAPWVIAANGERSITVYNAHDHTESVVHTPCVSIVDAHATGRRLALSCMRSDGLGGGSSGQPPATIVTVDV